MTQKRVNYSTDPCLINITPVYNTSLQQQIIKYNKHQYTFHLSVITPPSMTHSTPKLPNHLLNVLTNITIRSMRNNIIKCLQTHNKHTCTSYRKTNSPQLNTLLRKSFWTHWKTANYIRFKFKNDHHSNPIMATPPPTRTNNKQTDHTISTHHHISPNVLENDPTETQAHNHSTPSPINTENNTTNNTTRSGKSHKQRIKYKKEHTVENCLNPHCFTCAKNNIINLSDSTLTRNQILLLNKGLSFVPTAKNAPAHEILRDFNTITNKTKRKLKRLINPPRTPRPNDEPTLIRKTEQFNDNTNTQNLGPKPLEDAFLAMKNEIANIKETHTTKYNLTRGERLALTQLSSNHDLIINKADKGFTIVVRNRDEYIKAGLEHLSHKNTYISLERNYTNDVTHIITNTLKDLCTRGLISPNMKEYCLPPKSPRTALIYFLAKIHKNPIGIRPIVSTVNSATANLAECLDFYLQPIMKSLPAYLKDTGQFLEEISNIQVHKNTWLITVDVKSLYTNIPNDEGIQPAMKPGAGKNSLTPNTHQLKH